MGRRNPNFSTILLRSDRKHQIPQSNCITLHQDPLHYRIPTYRCVGITKDTSTTTTDPVRWRNPKKQTLEPIKAATTTTTTTTTTKTVLNQLRSKVDNLEQKISFLEQSLLNPKQLIPSVRKDGGKKFLSLNISTYKLIIFFQ